MDFFQNSRLLCLLIYNKTKRMQRFDKKHQNKKNE